MNVQRLALLCALVLAGLGVARAQGAMPGHGTMPSGAHGGMAGTIPMGQAMPMPPGMWGGGMMSPAMMAHMQGLMVMAQNTAAWTPRGLVVLQGNRLVRYDTNMRLTNQTVLPLPTMVASATTGTMGTTEPTAAPACPPGTVPGATMAAGMTSITSLVPTTIVNTDNGGLAVVRGMQVVYLDRNLRVTRQAMLPVLPPMTPLEASAACPMCVALSGFMPFGGSTVAMVYPGMTTMGPTAVSPGFMGPTAVSPGYMGPTAVSPSTMGPTTMPQTMCAPNTMTMPATGMPGTVTTGGCPMHGTAGCPSGTCPTSPPTQ